MPKLIDGHNFAVQFIVPGWWGTGAAGNRERENKKKAFRERALQEKAFQENPSQQTGYKVHMQ